MIKAELKAAGVEWVQGSDADEIDIKCPFHNDSNPSCGINTRKEKFNCRACDAKGSIYYLIARLTGKAEYVVRDRLTTKHNDSEKFIDPEVIEKYHTALLTDDLRKELYKRGVSDTAIQEHRLGLFSRNGKKKITIPVKNYSGVYVNLRKYSPGAKRFKFMSQSGMGANRLYPLDQLRFDTILICGGEVKALAALDVLNSHDIGAISTTGGESNWDVDFNPHFKDKKVYVCLDIDAAGQVGTHKICTALFTTVDDLYSLQLPLNIEEHPHGDLNDYLMQPDADLLSLLETATPFGLEGSFDQKDRMHPRESELSNLVTGQNIDLRFNLKCRVSAVVEVSDSLLVPQLLHVDCDKDQALCQICPIFKGSPNVKVFEEEPLLLATPKATKKARKDLLKEICGIPSTCKSCKVDEKRSYIMQSAVVGSDFDTEGAHFGSDSLNVMYVNNEPKLELNSTYQCTGTLTADPDTRQVKFLASQMQEVQDNLSTFKVKNPEELELFCPREWTLTSLEEKLAHIYADFAANVTGIVDREDFHVMCDLTYHSCLGAPVDNADSRGWVETFIVGDTSQGKTELTKRLIKHYGLGESIDCKNATTAGLLGGIEKMHDQFYVSWGLLPMNDRKLAVLEEFKGLKPEVWSSLTDMRSSGTATLPKIEKRQTKARTRLIVLSNPKSDQAMSSYSQGVLAVQELVPNREDLRRFDACMVLQEGDADVHKVVEHEHIYKAALCRKLILWSWTRLSGDVIVENMDELLEHSKVLSLEYKSEIPLFQDITNKLIRLSSALACRTFSRQGDKVLVRSCHVQYIVKMLRRVYNSSAFGFDAYVRSRSTELVDRDLVRKELLKLPVPGAARDHLLGHNTFCLADMIVLTSDRIKGDFLWSVLVLNKALVGPNKNKYKSPEFTKLLKGITKEEVDAPEYVTERKDQF